MDFVAISNTSASKTVEATGTGELLLTFTGVQGIRIEVTHISAEDEGGEAIARVIECDGTPLLYRRKFMPSATPGVLTSFSESANPICIASGTLSVNVRLKAGGTVGVLRRLNACVRYIPDVEISSAGLG